MSDLGEHIEEVIQLCKSEGIPLDKSNIRDSVIDIAFAQGLVDDPEDPVFIEELENQIEYML